MDALTEGREIPKEIRPAISVDTSVAEIMQGGDEAPKVALRLLMHENSWQNVMTPDSEMLLFTSDLRDKTLTTEGGKVVDNKKMRDMAYDLKTQELLAYIYPETRAANDHFRNAFDFKQRAKAWETVFGAIYGDEWIKFKSEIIFNFGSEANLHDSLVKLKPEEQSAKKIYTKPLAGDEEYAVPNEVQPLIGRDAMVEQYGIDGELRAMVAMGNPESGVRFGVVEMTPTQDQAAFVQSGINPQNRRLRLVPYLSLIHI